MEEQLKLPQLEISENITRKIKQKLMNQKFRTFLGKNLKEISNNLFTKKETTDDCDTVTAQGLLDPMTIETLSDIIQRAREMNRNRTGNAS